jgi:hypothetical protein
MNERIKELIALSTTTYYSGHGERDELDAEKFAELIVRECADFLKDKLDDHFAAEQLEEHFGVKE